MKVATVVYIKPFLMAYIKFVTKFSLWWQVSLQDLKIRLTIKLEIK